MAWPRYYHLWRKRQTRHGQECPSSLHDINSRQICLLLFHHQWRSTAKHIKRKHFNVYVMVFRKRFVTFIYPWSISINAVQTSGIINEIGELDALNRHISVLHESPVVKTVTL